MDNGCAHCAQRVFFVPTRSRTPLRPLPFSPRPAPLARQCSVSDGTGVHDSVVNQLLTKIDGVDSLDNILIIGMTNRLDMIDDALTRPGRLEVKVEIGLPDEEGRVQILNIHTGGMKTSKRLASDVNTTQLASTLRENRDYLLLTAHVVITSHFARILLTI